MKHNPYVIHEQQKAHIRAELGKFAIDASMLPSVSAKAERLLIHLQGLTQEVAQTLKQALLTQGGDAVFSGGSASGDGEVSGLLLASRSHVMAMLDSIRNQAGMATLAEEIAELFAREERLRQRTELVCGRYRLPLGRRTLVMGIVNATPDSFSDGGKYNDVDSAVRHAKALIAAGADIIDVGGESTRPGFEPVELAEELERVIPTIRALAAACDVPLSIDTYKAEVARQAIAAGAHIINDVWGAKRDPRMAAVAAQAQVPIILMHNRTNMDYTDFFSDVVSDLRESVDLVLAAGVKEENILLDPGIGFAKTLEQNLETMRRLDDIVSLGYPVLLGTSRKSMIGHVLGLPPDERMEGTAATVALGVSKGCQIVRVHDVKEMKRVVTMMDAMLAGGMQLG